MARSLALTTALLCAATLLPVASARAQTSYFGFAGADNQDPLNRLEDSHTGTTPAPAKYVATAGGNFATSTTDSANGGSVESYASTVSYFSPALNFNVMGSAGALGTVRYQPRLVGPVSSSLLVPVRVTASGGVSGSMAGVASASFAFTYRNGYYSDSIANLIGSTRGLSTVIAPTFSSSFSVDEIVYVAPNFDLFVKLDTSSQSGGLAPVSWAQSFVDPTFSIADPALAALYHFEGIPGMAPAVPEPAQWALMLLGLGGISGLRRRQRRLARLAVGRSGTIDIGAGVGA